MHLALADVPKRGRAPTGSVPLVAAAIAGLFLWAGASVLIGRDPPRPPAPSKCLADSALGALVVGYADSLEDCGARLEGLYVRDGEPVTGTFNGLRLFADAGGIDAATLHGPREHLFAPATRRLIDDAFRRLIDARRPRTMSVGVVRKP
ncbi:MAG: hypothetical protein ACXU82_14295 [Caulobacteraceae bacterium]